MSGRRILIIDDHQAFADALSLAMSLEDDLECVGVATSATEGVAVAGACEPDVIVIDLRLPDATGVDAILELRAAVPDASVVVVTGFTDSATFASVAAAGASGLVPKEGALSESLDAVRLASPDRLSISRSAVEAARRNIPRSDANGGPVTLTDREAEVLALLGAGLSATAIARRLSLSVHTCRGHIKSILVKLDAHSQLEAVARARSHGLLD